MRIAVFGGTGRTGRQVVTQALAAGHEVRVLVRSEDSARRLGRHHRLTAVVGTFEQPGPVEAVVKGAGAVISTLGATVEGPTTSAPKCERSCRPWAARVYVDSSCSVRMGWLTVTTARRTWSPFGRYAATGCATRRPWRR
jgi:6,7-dimethyl-8-ribityllumazine synthase